MKRKGRQVPPNEDRTPRHRQASVYLTDDEFESLEKFALDAGFRSKSALLAYMI